MQAGAFQKAMRLYTRALDLDPGNAILYSNRSAAHFNLRQFAESLEDAESAILCDATWWKAYKRKGLALIHMQRYEEAIEALQDGLHIVKKNAEMEKNLEFAKACHEQAQNLYILPEQPMMQKLESVPVFIVTDNVGQPFFVTYDDGQQVCTFYFDQEDANATLDWIKSENPGLGDTARVIHITLNQAFNLAQETQKQYYEETTRAAAEEDRLAAAAAKEGKTVTTKVITDVDGDDDDSDDNAPSSSDVKDSETVEGDTSADAAPATASDAKSPEETTKETPKPEADTTGSEPSEGPTQDNILEKNDTTDGDKKEEEQKDGAEKSDKPDDGDKEDEKKADKPDDDGVIDENAPLSFQFRPELRQVKIAVELLNKHPNPPVKPILRDPPSVRKAKAEAAAAAAKEKEVSKDESKEDPTPAEGTEKEAGDKVEDVKVEEGGPTADTQGSEKVEEAAKASEEAKKEDGSDSTKTETGQGDDEILTVDNFNGIPIFQAKGLTLLQKDKQLIPLFFSKWDLEEAWKQLKQSNAIDIPGECDIDVGTLEDVLRRMSECKTDEFKNVFFVPSRESMKAINAKFPLDELAATNHAVARLRGRPMVKKATFSKAKQIAARGGSKDEIRAAIKEDLEKLAERQRMADIIAQLENVGRSRGVNLSRMAASAGAGSSGSSTAKTNGDGNAPKPTSVS